jgi:hypothetical protein
MGGKPYGSRPLRQQPVALVDFCAISNAKIPTAGVSRARQVLPAAADKTSENADGANPRVLFISSRRPLPS